MSADETNLSRFRSLPVQRRTGGGHKSLPSQSTVRPPRRNADDMSARAIVICAGLIAMSLSGCAASIEDIDLPTGALSIPDVSMSLPETFATPTGSPADIYARVARGVLKCWMGAEGPLKATHLFHAVSEPARKGGRSQIALYKRLEPTTRKRGAKAATITITPSGGSADVVFTNLRLADRFADGFNTDVHRWAAGKEECAPAVEPTSVEAGAATSGDSADDAKAGDQAGAAGKNQNDSKASAAASIAKR